MKIEAPIQEFQIDVTCDTTRLHPDLIVTSTPQPVLEPVVVDIDEDEDE